MEISYATTSAIERATQGAQRTGVVTSYQIGGTVTVDVEGGSLTLPYVNSYVPKIGDVVQILAVRSGSWLVLGSSSPRIAPDRYDDFAATIPRETATSSFQPATGYLYLVRIYVPEVFNFTKIKLTVTTAGVGNASAAIYVGQSADSLVLYATNGFPVSPAGTTYATISTGQMFPGNPHVALGFRLSSVTTNPFLAYGPPVAHSSVLNPGPVPISVYKAGTSWPSSANFADGSWTVNNRIPLITLSV